MKRMLVLLAMLALFGNFASVFAEVDVAVAKAEEVSYWSVFAKTLEDVISAGGEEYVVVRKNCRIRVAVKCIALRKNEVRFVATLYERGKIIKEMLYVTAKFSSAEDAEIKGGKFGRKIKEEVRKIQTTRR